MRKITKKIGSEMRDLDDFDVLYQEIGFINKNVLPTVVNLLDVFDVKYQDVTEGDGSEDAGIDLGSGNHLQITPYTDNGSRFEILLTKVTGSKITINSVELNDLPNILESL